MTNAAKVRNDHFWTNLIEFRVFLIFKGPNEDFFRHNLYVNIHLNALRPLISFVFENISNCA